MTISLDAEEDGAELTVECDAPEAILFERTNREAAECDRRAAGCISGRFFFVRWRRRRIKKLPECFLFP
jgi:hypothetical protein